MNTTFLSTDEIRELTDRIQRASQSKVLRAMGIEHKTRPDGSIVVLRSHMEDVLSGGARKSITKSEPEINWNGVNTGRAARKTTGGKS